MSTREYFQVTNRPNLSNHECTDGGKSLEFNSDGSSANFHQKQLSFLQHLLSPLTMKFAILSSLFVGSVVAFAPVSQAPRASTQLYDGMADLEAIATKSNPLLKVMNE
jgi:hypothetical protein